MGRALYTALGYTRKMGSGFRHNIDPRWFEIGGIGIRYYTVFFLAAFVGGYVLFRWQAARGGYPRGSVPRLLVFTVLGVLIGARLAHCLLYQPAYYLTHPRSILFLWRGGLASHGAFVAMLGVLALTARRYRRPVLDIFDRFTFPAAYGAALVRLGNFFNSEIVGRETDVPWGVRFVRYDAGSRLRHPSQLYECVVCLFCLGLLLWCDRTWGKEKRPLGGLSAVFLVVYFTARFFIEFTKAFQRPMGASLLTMGQYLSILPILVGVYLLVRVYARGRRTMDT